METDRSRAPSRSDAAFYALAALIGMAAGYADVTINDLLFTALLVLMGCMVLGMLRPQAPWRWVVVIVLCIPLAELAAYKIMKIEATRGQMFGSFLTALPGLAGAYGGAVVRGVIEKLRLGR